jgi:hypothetical protein
VAEQKRDFSPVRPVQRNVQRVMESLSDPNMYGALPMDE